MRSLLLWSRALLRRRAVEREMRREMQLHIELETEENRRRGMAPEDARRAALVAFGGMVKAEEEVRDERRTRGLENLVADVRYALRGMRRRPGFSAMVIALVALGIGGNTALFSIVYHKLIAPLPFRDGNRMVTVWATGGQGAFLLPLDTAVADAWRRSAQTVEQVLFFGSGRFAIGDATRGMADRVTSNIESIAGDYERVDGAVVTPGAAAFIGMHPERGRDILPSDTLAGAPPVVLISRALWGRDFHEDPAIVGKTLLVYGVPHTIVGVVPPGFRMPFTDGGDVFLGRRALTAQASFLERSLLRGPVNDREVMAKLRPGRTVADANRELAAIDRRVRADRGSQNANGVELDAPRVVRAVDMVSPSLRRMVLVLFGAVSLVLIIACANVANLLLVRAWSRQREFAVRSAMGASRGRLVAQVLTESVLLSGAGAVVGVGLAALLLRVILQSRVGENLQGARLEPMVLVWCGALALVSALLFGLAPARFAAENRVNEALKSGARSATTGAGARRIRAALVGIELALSVILLCGAGLLVRTLREMQHADIGMDTRGLVSFRMSLPKAMSSAARQAGLRYMLERARAHPGIAAATYAIVPAPRLGLGAGGIHFDDRPTDPRDSLSIVGFNDVDPSFFTAVGLKLTQGRVFAPDLRDTSGVWPAEIIVNETFARRYWPNGDAVGRHIQYGQMERSTIVGVVRDVRVPGARDRRDDVQLYFPLPGAPTGATLVLRSTLPLMQLDSAVRAIARDAAAAIRVQDPVPADSHIADARAAQRSMLQLLGAFALVALLLAAIGLYAVTTYAVSQRTREIGLRVALGAQASEVVAMVIRQGLRVAIAGTIAGIAGAFVATRALEALLYGVQPTDPVTFAGVGLLLVAVAALASWPAARRAARLDPLEALRAE